MNAAEDKNNENTPEESPSSRRTRRTPSKFGSYYELAAVNPVEEEEEDELAEDDDSDEDPSWDDQQKGKINSFSKNYRQEVEEEEDDEEEEEVVSDDEDYSNSKKKRGPKKGGRNPPNANLGRGSTVRGKMQMPMPSPNQRQQPMMPRTQPDPNLSQRINPAMANSALYGMPSGIPLQQMIQQKNAAQFNNMNQMNWRSFPMASPQNQVPLHQLQQYQHAMQQHPLAQHPLQQHSIPPQYQQLQQQMQLQLLRQQQQKLQQQEQARREHEQAKQEQYRRMMQQQQHLPIEQEEGMGSITMPPRNFFSNESPSSSNQSFPPFKLPTPTGMPQTSGSSSGQLPSLSGQQSTSPYGSSQSLSSLLSPSPSMQMSSSPYSSQLGSSFTSQSQGQQNHFSGSSSSLLGLSQPSASQSSNQGQPPQLNLSPSLAAQSQQSVEGRGLYDGYFSRFNSAAPSNAPTTTPPPSTSSQAKLNPDEMPDSPPISIDSFFADNPSQNSALDINRLITPSEASKSTTETPTAPAITSSPASSMSPRMSPSMSMASMTSAPNLSTLPTIPTKPSNNSGLSYDNYSALPGMQNNVNPVSPMQRNPYPGPMMGNSMAPNTMPRQALSSPFSSPFGSQLSQGLPFFQFPFRNPVMRPNANWNPMAAAAPKPVVPMQGTMRAMNPMQPGYVNNNSTAKPETEAPAEAPKEEEDPEQDPQQRKLNSLVKQCEQYSNQIREIIRQWQQKSMYDEKLSQGIEEPGKEAPQIEFIRQPENLQHELRPYQLVGLNWLYLLFQQKINGILADEMGLGKTIQTISLFSLLKQRTETNKPHLVIVPATALENWVREFSEWCPSLNVSMYHGSAKERETLRKQLLPKEGGTCSFDVIITTYNLCINKIDRVKFFKKFDFCYIVLDEAHNIKNVSSIRYQNLLKLAFRADYRLMLTGTPLQNNINELWALLNFLMPNIFGCTKDLKDLLWLDDEEEESENTEEIQRLKKILSPFLLRRLKAEVLSKLPEKTEHLIWCNFTDFQRELYEKTYNYSKTKYHNYSMKEKEPKPKYDSDDEGIDIKNIQPELPLEVKKEDSQSKDSKEEAEQTQQVIFKSEDKGEEEKTLHHILMQLRKAANNALLFRHYYADDKIEEITARLLKENERKQEEENNEAEEGSTKRKKGSAPTKSSKKQKTEENETPSRGGEEEEEEEMDAELVDVKKETTKKPTNADDKDNEEAEVADNTGNVSQNTMEETTDETAENATEKSESKSKEHEAGSGDDDCGICGETGDLLLCDGSCSRAFHLTCLGIESPPESDKWYCIDCGYLVKDPLYTAEPTPDQSKYQSITDKVQGLQDKQGRNRSDLFIYLPAKQLYPDYYQIIKKPMSIYMIEQKKYQTPEQYRDDFYTLFNNAKTYNLPNSQVYRDAQSMQTCFDNEFSKLFPNKNKPVSGFEEDYEDMELLEDLLDDDEDEAPKKKKKSRSKRESPSTNRRSSRSRKSSYDEDDFTPEPPERRRSLRNVIRKSSKPTKEPPLLKKGKLSEPFLTCRNILEELMESDDCTPFNSPVDIEDYHKIVKNPMDLSTVWNKLNSKQYHSTDDFVGDVRTVFDNCLLYNVPSSQIGLTAQRLWSFFKRQCRKYAVTVGDEHAQLENKKIKREDLSSLPEELKLKSDLEIHLFCKNYDCLKDMCLTDEQFFNSSGKLIELRDQLIKFHEARSRVLIFSQFTQILNILEEFVARLGFKFVRLDGSTPVLERQLLIDEFNTNKDIFVFLLSTRAGGLGINLTSADVCIFHDIDWNPEMDRQAEARIHRIGQVKPVKIVKLLTKDTVDEYIFRMAQSKKQRNDLVMGEGQEKESEVPTEEKLSIGQVLASIFEKNATLIQ